MVWGLSSCQVKTNVRSRSYYHSAILITYQDSSEYIAHCDERRAYISGFNGSAGEQWSTLSLAHLRWSLGCAIVTLEKAFLFTDGRYFLQAEKQLDEYETFMPSSHRLLTCPGTGH